MGYILENLGMAKHESNLHTMDWFNMFIYFWGHGRETMVLMPIPLSYPNGI